MLWRTLVYRLRLLSRNIRIYNPSSMQEHSHCSCAKKKKAFYTPLLTFVKLSFSTIKHNCRHTSSSVSFAFICTSKFRSYTPSDYTLGLLWPHRFPVGTSRSVADYLCSFPTGVWCQRSLLRVKLLLMSSPINTLGRISALCECTNTRVATAAAPYSGMKPSQKAAMHLGGHSTEQGL